MTLTVEIDPARRTAAFREVSFLAAGDSCRVVLDGVRGADFGSLALLLYRDAASESPVASCSPFSAVPNHPSLADGVLALDTSEMAEWFEDAVPGDSEESDDSDDAELPRASASAEPRLAARASLAERSVRADGWLVVLDRGRTWAACRVPVLLRPGAGGHGASDPTSIRALVEGLVSAALADKADKAPPAAAGNLASLDASGNLADSGATPASIKAAAVAEVVANAPGTMDTLKEIADILGSSQQSGTVLKRISDLESGKVDGDKSTVVAGLDATASGNGAVAVGERSHANAVAAVQVGEGTNITPGSFQFRSANLFVDSGGTVRLGAGFPLASQSAPGAMSAADKEKLAGIEPRATALSAAQVDAVDSVVDDRRTVVVYSGGTTSGLDLAGELSAGDIQGVGDATSVRIGSAVTGVGSGAFSGCTGLASVTIPDGVASIGVGAFSVCTGLASVTVPDGVTSVGSYAFSACSGLASVTVGTGVASIGDLAFYGCTGLTDVVFRGKSLAEVSSMQGYPWGIADTSVIRTENEATREWTDAQGFVKEADFPYRLVEPGKWEFSDGGSHSVSVPFEQGGEWYYAIDTIYDSFESFDTEAEALAATSLTFNTDPEVTATRASLPGHLLDRAVDAVSVSSTTELTLPALVNAGKSRDLLVRLTVSADAAVTFSASSGETVTWDDAGSPTATYEAGTHLLRFTEVAPSVFHFTDLGDGGSIDPAVLNGKLEATSAAPAFDSTKTYSVGEYVTHEGGLYECTTAITTAGASWTGSSNWTARDMTTPDATLDLMADGRLRLVSADGEVLWMQGYGLASASSVTPSCDKVNFHAFAAAPAFDATASYAANDVVAYDGVVYVFTAAHAAGAWTGSDASVYAVALAMPTAPSGKVGDFVLDVDNTANASASVTATLTGAGTTFDVFTPEGVNLSTDILTFAGGEQCELYFTMTAFGTAAKPAWKVVKQIVEKQEFGS